jgi:hypothetical protein
VLLAEHGGVHADRALDGPDRAQLDRLEERADRRVTHRFKDGTHFVILDPLDFIARLAALVPPDFDREVPSRMMPDLNRKQMSRKPGRDRARLALVEAFLARPRPQPPLVALALEALHTPPPAGGGCSPEWEALIRAALAVLLRAPVAPSARRGPPGVPRPGAERSHPGAGVVVPRPA